MPAITIPNEADWLKEHEPSSGATAKAASRMFMERD
jgi:hypothetical protein